MTKYAERTTVNSDQSFLEIQRTLKRYGATRVALLDDPNLIKIGFEMDKWRFRFDVPLPQRSDFEERKVKRGYSLRAEYRSPSEIESAYDQAIRQKWRALFLVVKAKLEAVESGIETMEEAFMAQLVLPNGQTAGEWAAPIVEDWRVGGKMPPLLGSGM